MAGLTAAIQLKQSGFNPIVYEKESQIGAGRHGDYEGLENWIFPDEAPTFFQSAGFDFNRLTTHPISRFLVHTQNSGPLTVRSNQPFFYMVKRGSGKDDLDHQLYEQCHQAKVKFELGQKAPESCQIKATGTQKAAAYIRGINFQTKLKNQVHLLLGHKFAPKGYAYLIILGQQGTLATAYKKPRDINLNPLQNSRDYFNELGITIPAGPPFGSRGSFSLPFGTLKPPRQIGEAGGFQDYLFGFGIRMSMMSGKATALFILGKKIEAKTIIQELNRKRRLSFLNRVMYERLNDDQMARLAKKLSESPEPLSILSSAYAWNFKNILRWISMKQQYEARPT